MVFDAGENVACALFPPLLLHVYCIPPPAVSVALSPLQIVTVAGEIVAVGALFTETKRDAVIEQLLALVTVTVYVVVVAGLNVAAALLPPLLLQAYCVPPLAVRVAVCPLQIVIEAGDIEADGRLFTETKREAVALQLLASVTVTVYVVFAVGLNVACALLPPLLLQAYWVPPLAVNVAFAPLHTVSVAGDIDAVGRVFTFTVTVSISVQPDCVMVTV